jgi:hypothetical protein
VEARADQRWRRWLSLLAAMVLLDASVTFENVWPTPAIRWTGRLSIELAIVTLALLAFQRWKGTVPRTLLRCLSGLWVVLVVGRYVDVTTPALYGREVNLYWDLQFIPDVAAMLARAARIWLVIAAAVAVVAFVALAYWLMTWGMSRLATAVARPEERRGLAIAAGLAVVLFGVQWEGVLAQEHPLFTAPVSQTYARQVQLVAGALAGTHRLAASPPMNSDLALLQGADVLLVFIESYGAVTYDEPTMATHLAPDRAMLEKDIHETGHDVVSAFVVSPTFGGSSWLAHITLMSGIEVRDPQTNALLMTQDRETLVGTFGKHGYRTIAWMPGLWYPWPEGSFYKFDDIVGGARFEYIGPPFGWWDIPDQVAFAKLDAVETNKPGRAPLFVFFPTISTHTPFTPTPPYQPDWQRLLKAHPFDTDARNRSYEEVADWLNLRPGYAKAVSYSLRTIGGYLRTRSGPDFVMILIGDHQPPAAVSGEGAPWDVPVHVITNRREILDRLSAHGFRRGLTPDRPPIGPMQELLPIFLSSFGATN